jgi:hypothetical protein
MPNLRGMLILDRARAAVRHRVANHVHPAREADPGYLAALVAARTLVTIGWACCPGALIFAQERPGVEPRRRGSIVYSLAALAVTSWLRRACRHTARSAIERADARAAAE